MFQKQKPTTSASVDTTVIRDEGNVICVETQAGVLVRLSINGRLYTGAMLAENKNGEIVPAHGVGLAIRYGANGETIPKHEVRFSNLVQPRIT